jgi:beta propeller repeat protein
VFSVGPEEPYSLAFEARGRDIDIAWNKIVYSSGGDIVGYSLHDSLAFVVSTDVESEDQPAVWGSNIVWVSHTAAGPSIKYSTGQDTVRTVRPAGDGDPGSPDVSHKYVVWHETGEGGFDIYAYEVETGETVPVCTDPGDQMNPRIWGEVVVWEDRAWDGGDIHMMDLSTGEKVAVAAVEGAQVSPAISGDFIVWQDDRNGNWDIYGYRLKEREEFPVSRQVAAQTLPVVTDSSVVWIDGRGTYTEVRGLRFGGIRRVAEVSKFDALSQDGTIRVLLNVHEFDDQICYRLYRYPDGRQIPEGDQTHVRVGFELNEDTTFVFADTLIAQARNYFYTLGIVDGYGRETFVGPVAGNGYRSTPVGMVVGMPYPNPVKRDVRLSFGLPRRVAHASDSSWPVPAEEMRAVDVSVYNVQGRVVRRLLSKAMAPGYYQVTWDGAGERGTPVAAGIYFLAVSVDGAMTSRKVIMIR